MSFKTLLALTAAVLGTTAMANTSEGWSQLKAGMNGPDAAIALGDPLFKNVARGFELWIYDRGAEAVYFRGLLVAWTAPGGKDGLEGRQLDLRPFLTVAPKVKEKPAAAPAFAVPEGYELIPIRQMRLPRL